METTSVLCHIYIRVHVRVVRVSASTRTLQEGQNGGHGPCRALQAELLLRRVAEPSEQHGARSSMHALLVLRVKYAIPPENDASGHHRVWCAVRTVVLADVVVTCTLGGSWPRRSSRNSACLSRAFVARAGATLLCCHSDWCGSRHVSRNLP